MRGTFVAIILILSAIVPLNVIAEEEAHFQKGFFDKNGDGIDDRMNHLIRENKDVSVIVILHKNPSEKHINQINDIGLKVDHVYKYIDAIRIDQVPADKLGYLKNIDDVKIIEWQAPVYKFLDTAVRAIKVQGSEQYLSLIHI